MSQTIRIVHINDCWYPEIFTSFPDHDEAVRLITDMLEDDVMSRSEYYEVHSEWYEAGDGESGTDTFFSDEDIVDWFNIGGIKEVEKRFTAAGHDFLSIQDDTIIIYDEVLEENDSESEEEE